jgi:hypothetical protein
MNDLSCDGTSPDLVNKNELLAVTNIPYQKIIQAQIDKATG